jgi:hypothetical protein
MKYSLAGEETERLKFRLLKSEDFDDWLNLFKGKDVAKFLGMNPKLSDKELCEIWFEKTFERYEKGSGVMNALINKKTNLLIGQCGLLIQSVQNIERLEIGYSILPKYCCTTYLTVLSKYGTTNKNLSNISFSRYARRLIDYTIYHIFHRRDQREHKKK